MVDTPYTTPSEVKRRAAVKWDALNTGAGIPFADEAAFDSWLSGTVIPEIEKLINEFCRRPDFSKHSDEVECLNGDGFHSFIILSKKPVIVVSKLELNTDDGSWVLEAASHYFLRGDRIQFDTWLPRGFQNIRVTYDWGFNTIPEDVGYVAAEIVARFLQKCVAFKMGPLVRVGDYRVQLMNPDIFADDLKDTLQHYPRVTGAIV
jgi:hypothetical protein